ncbi:MAG: hypothetical protein ACK6EB_04330, partial [Planctomyces sp.]
DCSSWSNRLLLVPRADSAGMTELEAQMLRLNLNAVGQRITRRGMIEAVSASPSVILIRMRTTFPGCGTCCRSWTLG